MGCIITQSEISQPELVLNIHNEKEGSILLDERLSTYFKLNFIINIQTPLTYTIFKNIKEMLANLHKSLETSKESLNYYLMINFDHNLLDSELSFKMFRELTYFLHFTAAKYNRRLKCEFKFMNVLLSYKNLIIEACDIKWSIIYLQQFNINLVKEISLKFHFENFLLFSHTEVSLNSVLNILVENISGNYKCLIFPPILIQENQLHKLLEKLSKLKLEYLEIQLKLDINNFHKLKSLIDVLAIFINFFENLTLTLIFYNTKSENIKKVSELCLNLIPFDKFFSMKENRVFYVKLFFVIYESNSVDYKYYIFKRNSKKTKMSSFKNFSDKNPKHIMKIIFMIIQKKLIVGIAHKNKISKCIIEFLFSKETIPTSNISIENNLENFKSLSQYINNGIMETQNSEDPFIKSNIHIIENEKKHDSGSSSVLSQDKNALFFRKRIFSLTPTSNKNEATHRPYNSEGGRLNRETHTDLDQTNNSRETANFYLSEYQNRKFLIEDTVHSNDFNIDYKSKLIEFYKKP